MVCLTCNFENQPSAKFCGGCGARLTGALAPAAAPAAPESYTPKPLAERILRSRAALEGERKQVTVLFSDIKGSMELIQGTDPEDAQRILDPTIEAMMRAVHRYEGTVNKVLGDGIMALFGAPIAHEDHAVRACYAALAMQSALAEMSERTRRDFGVEVQVRTGLHSGEVVVRTIGNDLTMDYDAIGPTTHLASRMEQLALPGSIRMTADTLRLVEGLVQVRSLGPIPVKGLPQPVEIFELIGAAAVRSRLQASAVAGFTRFVGREREMDALNAALERAGSGLGQVVAVVGEPGVGKSRLYYEFVHSHRTRDWLVLESGSVSHGKATAYLPLIDLLKNYFQIESADDARRIREKVTGKLLTLDDSLRPTLPAFLALLDVPVDDAAWLDSDPAHRRRRTLEACRALLLREAQERPSIVVFEDLHWMDSESLAFIDGLIESLAKAPVLLLLNFRPEFRDRWSAKSYYTRIRIDPLPPQSAAELLQDRLGADASLRALKQLLIERTQGNPFFLEESVRTLIETGALAGQRGDYRLTTPLTAVALPVTVQSVLAARIDRLVPADKRLLQSASAVGNDFSLALLGEIADTDADSVQRSLANLQSAEFIYETRLFPDPEYTFKHALTHDVVYGGLLAERRQLLHAAVLTAIERLHAERLAEHVDRLAYHAARGGIWEKAHAYGVQAGEKAVAQSATRAALEPFETALAALTHLPETPKTLAQNIDLRFHLRDALFVLNERDAILPHLQQAQALAERIDDRKRLGLAALYESGYHWVRGEQHAAIAAGKRALAVAEALDDWEMRALAHYRLGQEVLCLGDYRAAVDHLRRAIAGLDHEEGRSMLRFGGLPLVFAASFAAWALAELGEFPEAEAVGAMGFDFATQRKHAYSISVASFGFGHMLVLQGRTAEAIRVLEIGFEQVKLHGVEAALGFIASRLAHAYAKEGRREECLSTVQTFKARVLPGTAPIGPEYYAVTAAEITISLIDAAAQTARRLLGQAAHLGDRGSVAWTEHLLGDIALADGTGEEAATTHYRTADGIASELGMRPLQVHCRLGLGNAARRAGRTAVAKAEFQAALEMAETLDMAPAASEARQHLQDLAVAVKDTCRMGASEPS
jgi:class 3 adenylate cyclase/tetratricopeptide (TPR) repeat protein